MTDASNDSSKVNYVFFGGEPLAVPVLEELKKAALMPALIVCSPDRPVGRKQILTPPPAKAWAEENDIPTWQPESLKDRAAVIEKLSGADVFAVVAYNKILPGWLLDIPKHGALNLHPSLLPLMRGPSPIRSAILEDKPEAVGVSIIKLDEEMDHGPIVAREAVAIPTNEWPIDGRLLDHQLAEIGGALLATTLPQWVAGSLPAIDQNHQAATYTKKLTRADGEIELDPFNLPSGYEARELLCKIRAFSGWPETFFMHDGKRIKIKEAKLAEHGELDLLSIVPEGKSETDFPTWLQSLS